MKGFRIAFGLLAGSVAFSVVGMFLMRYAPDVVVLAAPVLSWLIRVPTWIYMVAAPLTVFFLFLPQTGARLGGLLLAWGAGVGLTAELLGTTSGWPFGPYAYTDVLGPKILGHVPFTIPPSWYAVALLSFGLAALVTSRPVTRVPLAALYMVLWDVALDPAMSFGFPAWRWGVDGFFYGMPALNLAGWFATSLILCAGLERLTRGRLTAPTWTTRVWLTSAALSIGIAASRDMWWAVLFGTAAVAVPVAVPALRRHLAARRAPESISEGQSPLPHPSA